MAGAGGAVCFPFSSQWELYQIATSDPEKGQSGTEDDLDEEIMHVEE